MTTLNWKPIEKEKQHHSSTEATNDPWFGVALGLVGVILGYGISLLHIL